MNTSLYHIRCIFMKVSKTENQFSTTKNWLPKKPVLTSLVVVLVSADATASGVDALSLLDNIATRSIFVDELSEVTLLSW